MPLQSLDEAPGFHGREGLAERSRGGRGAGRGSIGPWKGGEAQNFYRKVTASDVSEAIVTTSGSLAVTSIIFLKIIG